MRSFHKSFINTIFVIASIFLIIGLWKLQQNNIESLDDKIKNLQQNIKSLKQRVEPKEKLILEKDILILEKDKVNAQNAIYVTLIQTLGGLFFFVTAYLTWRNVKATEQKQVTERFSKAVEQLASDKMAIQLGGIYSLERIIIDSPKDKWTIMEILASFIQENSVGNHQEEIQPITIVIQSALKVIGKNKLNSDQDNNKLDLSNTNLARSNIKDTDFQGAIFANVDFRKANLENSNFRKVFLGNANFNKAILNKIQLDKVNCQTDFPVLKVDFSEAFLLNAKLSQARLTKSNFSKADLSQSNLKSSYLFEANFNGTILTDADLSKADLSNAKFNEAILDGAKLNNALLYQTNFIGAKGLKIEQVKTGKNWEKGIYDEEFRKRLGLDEGSNKITSLLE